jgi:predicted PurR-regulated permease PerM/CheY-like chemotaxis protein
LEVQTINPKRANSSPLLRVITVAAVVAALRFGKELVIPLTLAVLLSFLLTYPVTWLERLKLGRVFSVVVVLAFALSAAGGMIWIGTQQLAEIVNRLPQYQANIQRKMQRVQNPAGSGFAKAANNIYQVANQFSPENAAAKKVPNPAAPAVPVEVIQRRPTMFDSLGLIGGSVLRFFTTAIAVAILTFFMLLRRTDLRNRVFRLFGQGRINVMTTAMDDAAKRVSRYLLTQSIVNSAFGLLLGTGLSLIGVPFAAFWGFLGATLRFVPYVGTWTAGLCPFILALAVFEGWRQPLLCIGLFAVVELTMAGLVEPWIYATRTGISSLAILLSAAFWTMLWGPIGLVVSTPLTVLLFVLGRYIPQLEFLYILLGDEPVLPPDVYYYQRLIAMDEDEAREVAEEYLKDRSPIDLYDAVFIPALSLAERDRHQSQLEEERQKLIYDTTRELIEDVGEGSAPESWQGKIETDPSQMSILCMPARDEADELVALMLAQILRHAGHQTEFVPIGRVEEMLAKAEQCQPDVMFISALPPFAISHARSLCRKVRQRYPGMRVVVGLWGSATDPKTVQQRLGSGCSDHLVHTLEEAQLQLRLFREQAEVDTADVEPDQPQHASLRD